MTKARYTDLTVEEINEKVDELDEQITALREEKKELAVARATVLQQENRVARLSNLSEEDLNSLNLEKPFLQKVLAFKSARPQSQPPAQRAAPHPVRGKAKADR